MKYELCSSAGIQHVYVHYRRSFHIIAVCLATLLLISFISQTE